MGVKEGVNCEIYKAEVEQVKRESILPCPHRQTMLSLGCLIPDSSLCKHRGLCLLLTAVALPGRLPFMHALCFLGIPCLHGVIPHFPTSSFHLDFFLLSW